MGADFGGRSAGRNWLAAYSRSRRSSHNKAVIVGTLAGLIVVAGLLWVVTRPQTARPPAESLVSQSPLFPPPLPPPPRAAIPRNVPVEAIGEIATEAAADAAPMVAPSLGAPIPGTRAKPYLIPPPQARDRGKVSDPEEHALFHGLGKNQSPPKVEARPVPPADATGKAGPTESVTEGTP